MPQCLPYNLLYQVALLCDKYECVDKVKPWLTEKAWLLNKPKGSALRKRQDWLRIAQIFGLHATFENIVRHMAANITVESEGITKFLNLLPSDIKGELKITSN